MRRFAYLLLLIHLEAHHFINSFGEKYFVPIENTNLDHLIKKFRQIDYHGKGKGMKGNRISRSRGKGKSKGKHVCKGPTLMFF